MTIQQPSIILLVPYFGKWPEWFEFFLLSCKFNNSIQWQFYTDCIIPENPPDNVKFNSISFFDYKNKVSEALNINFNPDSAYKLCDLKPVLGFIHEDDIEGFDFWGFSDIDLVYGDLRKYYTAERLNKFDFFSTHERRVSGHLCLMRNTKKMREDFRFMKNWEVRLADNKHHALDEGAFSRLFIRHKNFPKWLFKLFAYFNPWRRSSEFAEAYSTPNAGVKWIDGTYNFPNIWFWSSGKLTNDLTGDREFPYFHFYGWKKYIWEDRGFEITPIQKSSAFAISKFGFRAEEKG